MSSQGEYSFSADGSGSPRDGGTDGGAADGDPGGPTVVVRHQPQRLHAVAPTAAVTSSGDDADRSTVTTTRDVVLRGDDETGRRGQVPFSRAEVDVDRDDFTGIQDATLDLDQEVEEVKVHQFSPTQVEKTVEIVRETTETETAPEVEGTDGGITLNTLTNNLESVKDKVTTEAKEVYTDGKNAVEEGVEELKTRVKGAVDGQSEEKEEVKEVEAETVQSRLERQMEEAQRDEESEEKERVIVGRRKREKTEEGEEVKEELVVVERAVGVVSQSYSCVCVCACVCVCVRACVRSYKKKIVCVCVCSRECVRV